MTIENIADRLKKRLSVVTPVYKPDKRLFSICIKNMLGQTSQEYEWYLVFDGEKSYYAAQDCERFGELEKLNNVHITVLKNRKGVSAARNVALDQIPNGYVMYLDSDNWLYREAVNFLKQAIEQTELDQPHFFTVCQAIRMKSNHMKHTELYSVVYRPVEDIHFERFLTHTNTDLGQIIHTVGTARFNENMDRLVDWHYILQLMKRGYQQIAMDGLFLSFYDGFDRPHRISNSHDYMRNRARLILDFIEDFKVMWDNMKVSPQKVEQIIKDVTERAKL